jgi:anti-anti-sigma factor
MSGYGPPAAGQATNRLLSVHVTRDEHRLAIVPMGELDMSTSAKLDDAVREAEATDAKRIVIDLTAVTFMDSSGLKVLLEAGARARANSNRLRLVRGSRRVQRVFELTKTSEILPFLD